MKAYLRLMFVELILLLAVGLFCNGSEEVKEQNQKPPEIGQVQWQQSNLPVSSRFTPAPLFSSDYPQNQGAFSNNPGHLEHLTTLKINNQYSLLSSEYANRRPGLTFRTGLFVQSITDTEEAPLL